MDWKSIITGVVGSVLGTIVLGGGGYLVNLATSGALVRALGGMTEAQVAAYIEKRHPATLVHFDDVKLEVVSGTGSSSTKNDNGSFEAYAEPTSCPNASILIGGYCGIDDYIKKGIAANLQRAGLGSDGSFYCTWNNVNKPDAFHGWAQPMCVRLSKK